MMLPFVLVNNPFFKLIISELGAGETAMSDTTLTTVLLPKTNKKVMDFVKSQLKDREVCMIVDAMTRYDKSYSNFLVSCHSDKLVRGIEHHPTPAFFSTMKVMDEGTSQHIGFTIGSVINELRENDIHVVSYPTHNSALIRNTQSFLQNTLLHPVQCVSCSFHVLNRILKDLLKLEPFHSV